jgi:hypothetical protein
MLDSQTGWHGVGSGDYIRNGENIIGKSQGKDIKNEGIGQDQEQIMG